jgi:aminoglycoside/choline kinase family phosphotransferase
MSQSLAQLFLQATGKKVGSQVALTASGSNRRYYRITSMDGSVSLIGVQGTSRDENKAFLEMAKHFKSQGLNVPEVKAVSDDEMAYVQEDLGDTLLFDYIADGRKTGSFCEREKALLRKTMRALAVFQVKGADKFNFSICYPQPDFNLRSIQWDLNYFKYCFLKATGLDYQEDMLENEFERLAYILLQPRMHTFMYRDFQSRNVMVCKKDDGTEVPYFIDFQGGRKGPVFYDVASFLWQAKANFHPDLREELVEVYLEELQKYMPVDRELFYETLKHFVLFRTMQVLGSNSFRSYFEK